MKYDEMISSPLHKEWLELVNPELGAVINAAILATFGRDKDIHTYCAEDLDSPRPEWLTSRFEHSMSCAVLPGEYCALVIGYDALRRCLMMGISSGPQSAIPVYFYTDD